MDTACYVYVSLTQNHLRSSLCSSVPELFGRGAPAAGLLAVPVSASRWSAAARRSARPAARRLAGVSRRLIPAPTDCSRWIPTSSPPSEPLVSDSNMTRAGDGCKPISTDVLHFMQRDAKVLNALGMYVYLQALSHEETYRQQHGPCSCATNRMKYFASIFVIEND